MRGRQNEFAFTKSQKPVHELWVTLNYADGFIELEWVHGESNIPISQIHIRCTGPGELRWTPPDATPLGAGLTTDFSRKAIREAIDHFRHQYPTREVLAGCIRPAGDNKSAPSSWTALDLPTNQSPWIWLECQIEAMAKERGLAFEPEPSLGNSDYLDELLDRERRRLEKETDEARALRERIEAGTRHRREQERRKAAARAKSHAAPTPAIEPSQAGVLPVPPIPMRVDWSAQSIQETLLPEPNLRSYFLREKAALWWISNQSDDLLGLPYCRIARLEYQVRTALRVIGPMRGRALLSDEVGLGKTIEAGLVLKEYLTRGMVKKFLILTVPSLVDQWEEELQEKFDIQAATTNHAAFRSDASSFWKENSGIVASLHTIKQPAHLAIAQTVAWDMLVVDEAHYLRNRASQAWSAVNGLPRQFLLLLTATPVQNSLEELYNLVTLLQPGQLPSPREFRERFVDHARPHQPREPEELRRLLGQVMIRNTRANAGIDLPPRRAEVVLFEPEPAEKAECDKWEQELREDLKKLSTSLASLWGRLLLQAAGSSPHAWRSALASFPLAESAQRWTALRPFESSWKKKTEAIVPLTKGEGGVVLFTQFLETQAALGEALKAAGAPVWIINGQTPARERQPISEEFRRQGGALLLTHSGTEGRNLQFCHRLVNFDLPWNPMEIEQRIGRLHRIGQEHPVSIYNLVQAGSLQEHLLRVLQEKLNLFELVVGETGLILGDRFSSHEFADEILKRWRESESVADSIEQFGEELAAARGEYQEIKKLDETLFAHDFESL